MNRRPTRPSDLKSVKKNPNSWGKRVDEWRLQQVPSLSVRDLAGICQNRIGKTTVHRICSGGLDTRMEALVKPIIAESIREFLRIKGQSALEIEQTICAIFSDPTNRIQETMPVLTQRSDLSREAQQFFGLKRDPFDPQEPRTRQDEFSAPALDKIARQVEDAVNYQGFLAVIGGIGSGKSIQKRRICETAKQSADRLRIFWPKFYNMDQVHSGSIVTFLLHELGQSEPRDKVSRAAKLEKVLAELSEQGVRIALGFDECHRLHKNVIVALKNFWEAGSGGYDRYLGVILFGWPLFEDILLSHREILERCSIIKMPGLGKQAASYIEHRLTLAGGRLDKLFEPTAVSRMLKLADTPLALGNVANAALRKAFEVNERKVTAAFIPEKNGDPHLRAIRKA